MCYPFFCPQGGGKKQIVCPLGDKHFPYTVGGQTSSHPGEGDTHFYTGGTNIIHKGEKTFSVGGDGGDGDVDGEENDVSAGAKILRGPLVCPCVKLCLSPGDKQFVCPPGE